MGNHEPILLELVSVIGEHFNQSDAGIFGKVNLWQLSCVLNQWFANLGLAIFEGIMNTTGHSGVDSFYISHFLRFYISFHVFSLPKKKKFLLKKAFDKFV